MIKHVNRLGEVNSRTTKQHGCKMVPARRDGDNGHPWRVDVPTFLMSSEALLQLLVNVFAADCMCGSQTVGKRSKL